MTRKIDKEEFVQWYMETMKERKRKRNREYNRYREHMLFVYRRGRRV